MQTIGQKLKAAREEKNLTLEKVFQATRIRERYLQALEDDDHSIMPSPVQARGYLRNYAEYLGFNFEQLLEEMRASQPTDGEMITPVDVTAQPAVSSSRTVTDQETTLLSPPVVDTAQDAESTPEPTPSKPKRRGRKKAEPEPIVEPQPEIIEEAIPQPEPVVEEIVQDDAQPEPDMSDKVWQSWLNRLGSVISVRGSSKSEMKEVATAEQVEIPEPIEPPQHQAETSKPESLQPSDEIFKEIGVELRNRRETLSLHLEEVERNTHVKAHYLEALELGAMDRLPSAVQTRGMLSNYASFLDMNVDAILLRFADALQARHRENNPQLPVRKPGQPILSNMPPLRNFIAGDMIFGIGIAVLLVGFVIWGINRVLTLQSLEEIQPTAPSISDVLLASPDPSLFTPTATFLPVESFPGDATATIIIPTVNVNVRVQVNLVAAERAYMRVTVDEKVVFNGRTIPGNAYPFEGEDQVEVLVGNGAAIRVVYNGRDLGLMGNFGQVVSNIYRADEIITPTALPSPTPTNTVPPSPTLRPTITPVPSRTPLPSNTPVQ